MDEDPKALRQRLAEVDERIDRIGKRLTAGYGSDADRDGWLTWLRDLGAKRTAIVGALERTGSTGRDAESGGHADADAHEQREPHSSEEARGDQATRDRPG